MLRKCHAMSRGEREWCQLAILFSFWCHLEISSLRGFRDFAQDWRRQRWHESAVVCVFRSMIGILIMLQSRHSLIKSSAAADCIRAVSELHSEWDDRWGGPCLFSCCSSTVECCCCWCWRPWRYSDSHFSIMMMATNVFRPTKAWMSANWDEKREKKMYAWEN